MAALASVTMASDQLGSYGSDHQMHTPVDYSKMKWWQRLQYTVNCCLMDWLVMCFCKKGKWRAYVKPHFLPV